MNEPSDDTLPKIGEIGAMLTLLAMLTDFFGQLSFHGLDQSLFLGVTGDEIICSCHGDNASRFVVVLPLWSHVITS